MTGDDPKFATPPTAAMAELLAVLARLRAPGGCPWDREQDEASMAPHLLEETYEAIEAIQAADWAGTCEELGDVLMNVLMIAQIAREHGRFDSEDVARGIAAKLVRRHPHVFGDVDAEDSDTVLRNWEAIKRAERRAKSTDETAADGGSGGRRGVLDGLPAELPALLRAFRTGEKVARVGFDWPDATGPRAKLDEELRELDDALAGGDTDRIEDELGDVLFAACNVARHHAVHPEMALRRTVQKFHRRFAAVEAALGDRLGAAPLTELEAAWQAAKANEPTPATGDDA